MQLSDLLVGVGYRSKYGLVTWTDFSKHEFNDEPAGVVFEYMGITPIYSFLRRFRNLETGQEVDISTDAISQCLAKGET